MRGARRACRVTRIRRRPPSASLSSQNSLFFGLFKLSGRSPSPAHTLSGSEPSPQGAWTNRPHLDDRLGFGRIICWHLSHSGIRDMLEMWQFAIPWRPIVIIPPWHTSNPAGLQKGGGGIYYIYLIGGGEHGQR